MTGQMEEKDYFDGRLPEYTYVSKVFPGRGTQSAEKRFIWRKLLVDGQERVERVTIEGEYLIRRSRLGNLQVRLLVTQDDSKVRGVVLQHFAGNKGTEISFSFRGNELSDFLDVLDSAKLVDLSKREGFRVPNADLKARSMLVSSDERAFLDSLRSAEGEQRAQFLDALRKSALTRDDIEVLSGRRRGLTEFEEGLTGGEQWAESRWQKFFEDNTWIFGYGLDYRFLQILQREASLSGVDLDGKNEVISDFLLGSSKFTVVVELKRPDTALFGSAQGRARSWSLSNDLTQAVSQILAQKAEWEVKSRTQQFVSGQPILQRTHDPKTILVIGSTKQFSGVDRESFTKAQTFELYRRNMRNVEILTYDELLERAYFIVNQTSMDKEGADEPDEF